MDTANVTVIFSLPVHNCCINCLDDHKSGLSITELFYFCCSRIIINCAPSIFKTVLVCRINFIVILVFWVILTALQINPKCLIIQTQKNVILILVVV